MTNTGTTCARIPELSMWTLRPSVQVRTFLSFHSNLRTCDSLNREECLSPNQLIIIAKSLDRFMAARQKCFKSLTSEKLPSHDATLHRSSEIIIGLVRIESDSKTFIQLWMLERQSLSTFFYFILTNLSCFHMPSQPLAFQLNAHLQTLHHWKW